MRIAAICVHVAAMGILAVFIGCDEDSSSPVSGFSRIDTIGFIVIYSATDTLWLMPGDSASTFVTIIVSDHNGNTVPGTPVEITLSDSTLGYLENVDPVLRDTTDEQGHVHLIFTGYREGEQRITVEACGWRQTLSLPIREWQLLIGTVSVSIAPRVIYAHEGDEVSAQLKIVLSDVSGQPISDFPVYFFVPGGRFSAPPVTNDSGIVRATWIFTAHAGQHCLTVIVADAVASPCVEIITKESAQGRHRPLLQAPGGER